MDLKNNLLCIEPGIYDEDNKLGIRIEEPVVITQYGAKTLLEF